MQRPSSVTPYSRDYRKPPGWGMGLPPRRPRRRLPGPRFWLNVVMGAGLVGLLALPIGTDAIAAAMQAPAMMRGDCAVLAVIDGDTVTIRCPAKGIERARLDGIDTPELFSPQCLSELVLATRATWALRWWILTARKMSVVRTGSDRYGRALAFLALDGVNVAHRMVNAGLARRYDGGQRGHWCN